MYSSILLVKPASGWLFFRRLLRFVLGICIRFRVRRLPFSYFQGRLVVLGDGVDLLDAPAEEARRRGARAENPGVGEARVAEVVLAAQELLELRGRAQRRDIILQNFLDEA